MPEQVITRVENFFSRYKNFSQQASASIATQDIDKYTALVNRFTVSRIDALNADRVSASEFNIFTLLGVQRKEALVHTPFLTSLLNPKGTHSQGDLFYKSFLSQVLGVENSVFHNASPAYLRVKNEWYGGIYGRMDIVINHSLASNRFALIIENKIGAGDQEKQLENYYKYLTRQLGYSDEQICLFYLTPFGDPPSSYSISDSLRSRLTNGKILVNISYQKDIVEWLEKSIPFIQSNNVLHTVQQYLKTVKEHCL